MQLVKKLIFAFPFLACFFFMLFIFKDISNNPEMLLALEISVFYKIILFLTLIIFSGLFFCIFISFARELKFVGPIILLSLLIPLLFFPDIKSPIVNFELARNQSSFILIVGFLLTESIIFYMLDNTLKTYINFSPTQIFIPFIKRFTQLFLLTFALGYFVLLSNYYQINKFKIPDSLIDTALKSIPKSLTSQTDPTSVTVPPKIKLTPEQLTALKQNPKNLEQFGLTVSDLENLSNPTTVKTPEQKEDVPLDQQLIKLAVRKQIDEMIKPYINFIPITLSVLFFFTSYSLSSLLLITAPIILLILFKILEGTGFITYTKEMREVKKMVI